MKPARPKAKTASSGFVSRAVTPPATVAAKPPATATTSQASTLLGNVSVFMSPPPGPSGGRMVR